MHHKDESKPPKLIFLKLPQQQIMSKASPISTVGMHSSKTNLSEETDYEI